MGRRALRIGACLLVIAAAAEAAGDRDLSVGWISRLPRIDYVWGSEDPAVEGWPAPGEAVQWVAHVRNLSDERLDGVGYRWLLDGEQVEEGTVSLEARSTTALELPWSWTFERHELVFEIDPEGAVDEIEKRNNRLLVHTDAVGVGVWVERTFWDSIRPVVAAAGIGGTTFDDWMQISVRRFNDMAAFAIYPETPDGALDRWRVDAIHLVEDGSLPLVPPGAEVRDWGASSAHWATLYPDSRDRTVDMQWGFPAHAAGWYSHYDAWIFTIGNSLVHELGHARYLIDVYAWNVSEGNDDVQLSPAPPRTEFGRFHRTRETGLMNTQWGFLDRYSAAALNRITGHRATMGNYNEPSNIGVFLDDLPAENRVRLVTPDGRLFPRRTVRIYRASGERDPDWQSHPYRLTFDATPDLVLETDEEGAVLVGRNPFSDGKLYVEVDRNNVMAIVELIDGSERHWGYLESRVFNLAYWRGETEMAEHVLVLDAPDCFHSLGPSSVSPHPEELVRTPLVTFRWPGERGHDYELWTSVDGAPSERLLVQGPRGRLDLPVEVTVALRGSRVHWWIVDHDPAASGCPPPRSPLYAFDLDTPPRPRRRSVTRP